MLGGQHSVLTSEEPEDSAVVSKEDTFIKSLSLRVACKSNEYSSSSRNDDFDWFWSDNVDTVDVLFKVMPSSITGFLDRGVMIDS